MSAAASYEPPVASAGRRLGAEPPVTPNQLELLALYASGYSYEQIGSMKFLSPYTVRNTMKLALGRTEARNLRHLCAILAEHGMIRRNARGDYEPVQDLRIVGE